MRQSILSALPLAFALLLCAGAAQADGTKPVTGGPVVRGLTLLPRPPGANPGDSTGKTCDFSKEEVNQSGKLTGASVNCGADATKDGLVADLPTRFNAYCVVRSAPVKSARLIPAALSGNATHCDLSGITPQDATHQFGGAVWR